MTGRIPEDKIQEIRDRVDIVEVVSSYLPLKRSGANHQGLCPFHGEKTPSFNVNAPRQIFHCFGCGVGGNVFSFLMRIEGLSFPEAVKRLGERVGVEVEEEQLSPQEQRRREERERLTRINEVACEFYHGILLEDAEGAPARRYLRDRGYDGETARTFRLGYAPRGWEALADHLKSKGFDPEGARQLGLIRPGKEGRGDYDLFRQRLIFPIRGLRGEVIAFGGRVLDDSLPKYINSPESPIYHKGRILYGLYQAREEMRKTGEVVVVEGYFDQLALCRSGFSNAVATCGTALTEEHGQVLKRYAKRVLLLFDQDKAGLSATFRAMEVLLTGGLQVAVVELDPGEDPDSFVQRCGAEAFAERLTRARPVIEVFIDATLKAAGDSIEGKARAAEEVVAKLRLLGSDLERDLYVKDFARRTGLDEDLLRRRLREAPQPPPPRRRPPAAPAGQGQQGPPGPPGPPGPGAPPPPQEPPEFRGRPVPASPPSRGRPSAAGREVKAQHYLLGLMAAAGGIRRKVEEEGGDQLFIDPDCRQVAEVILRLGDQDEAVDKDRLAEQLSAEQNALLSGIVVGDSETLLEDSERLFEDCRRAVRRVSLKRRIEELDQLIAKADEEGQPEQHTELLKERTALTRQLKK